MNRHLKAHVQVGWWRQLKHLQYRYMNRIAVSFWFYVSVLGQLRRLYGIRWVQPVTVSLHNMLHTSAGIGVSMYLCSWVRKCDSKTWVMTAVTWQNWNWTLCPLQVTNGMKLLHWNILLKVISVDTDKTKESMWNREINVVKVHSFLLYSTKNLLLKNTHTTLPPPPPP